MKYKSTLIFLLSFFHLLSLVSGQKLQRKGSFGVQMQVREDPQGIEILRVFPNSTASALQLMQGDIIKQINRVDYSDVSSLVKAIGHWKADDPIHVVFIREGKEYNREGAVVGKPLETSEVGQVFYGEVDFDGGKLRSILELPQGIESPPVIYFLPGIGCGSLDYYYNPKAPIKLLVEELVKQGNAVYRVEKPGMGDSYGPVSCEEMDFTYEVAALAEGLKVLKSIPSIDSSNIFLYGHSLGVVSAPLIAKQSKVKGIIAWGGISKSWYEYSLKLLKDQKTLFGQDYVAIEEDFRKLHPFYIDFYINKKKPNELIEDPRYKAFAKHYFQGDMWFGVHHYSYFHTLNEVDILTAYKEADCPVYCLAGEFDIHAIDTKWAFDIAAAVQYYKNKGDFAVVPKTTHHYHTVPSLEFYNELRNSNQVTGKYISDHFNADVPLLVNKWIKEILKG